MPNTAPARRLTRAHANLTAGLRLAWSGELWQLWRRAQGRYALLGEYETREAAVDAYQEFLQE